MFHECVQRFDGMDEKFLGGKLNRASEFACDVNVIRSPFIHESARSLSWPCVSHLNFFHSSHPIFGYIHRVLNININKNQLHSLVVNRETNLLKLVRL